IIRLVLGKSFTLDDYCFFAKLIKNQNISSGGTSISIIIKIVNCLRQLYNCDNIFNLGLLYDLYNGSDTSTIIGNYLGKFNNNTDIVQSMKDILDKQSTGGHYKRYLKYKH